MIALSLYQRAMIERIADDLGEAQRAAFIAQVADRLSEGARQYHDHEVRRACTLALRAISRAA